MQTKNRLPRILSCKKAKNPRNFVTIYANVQSVSRPTRVVHTVTGIARTRKTELRCSCERQSFDPLDRKGCRHIQAVRLRLRRTRKRSK
jgi:hypothetical protein